MQLSLQAQWLLTYDRHAKRLLKQIVDEVEAGAEAPGSSMLTGLKTMQILIPAARVIAVTGVTSLHC